MGLQVSLASCRRVHVRRFPHSKGPCNVQSRLASPIFIAPRIACLPFLPPPFEPSLPFSWQTNSMNSEEFEVSEASLEGQGIEMQVNERHEITEQPKCQNTLGNGGMRRGRSVEADSF